MSSQAQAQLAALRPQLAALSPAENRRGDLYQIVVDEPKGISLPSAAKRGMPSTLDKAVALGLQQHPSILAAEHVVDSSGYQVKTRRGSAASGVAIQGSVGRKYGNPSSLSSPRIYNSAMRDSAADDPGSTRGAPNMAGPPGPRKRLGANHQIRVDSARLSVRQSIVSAYAQNAGCRSIDHPPTTRQARQAVSASNLALSG